MKAPKSGIWPYFVKYAETNGIDLTDLPGVWFEEWQAFLAGTSIGAKLAVQQMLFGKSIDGEGAAVAKGKEGESSEDKGASDNLSDEELDDIISQKQKLVDQFNKEVEEMRGVVEELRKELKTRKDKKDKEKKAEVAAPEMAKDKPVEVPTPPFVVEPPPEPNKVVRKRKIPI